MSGGAQLRQEKAKFFRKHVDVPGSQSLRDERQLLVQVEQFPDQVGRQQKEQAADYGQKH